MTANPIAAFAFSAQSPAGDALSGTINAGSVAQAREKLQLLQLRVIELNPQRNDAPKAKKLSGDDFAAFNTQLAYLATAGLPIEKSLRLIADDMRAGTLAETIKQVATDLESGQSLPEAFATRARQFPPLYSELVNAGIRTGNLPGMLLGLGRHLELTRRLRGMLWRAASYPLMVFVSLLLVISFLGIFVFPQFKHIFNDFKVDLPAVTQLMMAFSDFMVADWPIVLGIVIVIIAGPPLLLRSITAPEVRQQILELFLFPIPVIGRAVKQNLLARWCDAMKLGVEAGLDLPAAITQAGHAVGSPQLIGDGASIVEALDAGHPLDDTIRIRLIPQTVIAVLSLAATSNDLPSGLHTLSLMFQQQAELKMALIPTVLTPMLIILLAIMIGFIVIALFAPMIALITAVSGPMK